MAIPNYYFNLRYRENLAEKNKMPENFIKNKIAILRLIKSILIINDRVIIANIELMQMKHSKWKKQGSIL